MESNSVGFFIRGLSKTESLRLTLASPLPTLTALINKLTLLTLVMPSIHHQFTVNAKATTVFEAFTSSKGLDNWWPLKSSGQPKLGTEYSFFFRPEYDWRAEVVHVGTDKELTWKMTQAMDDWKSTRVGFHLREEKGSTIVYFFHEGRQEASEHFAITTYCWGQLLAGLKNCVEKGVIIPFENRN